MFRSCTDIICCLLFVGYIVGMVVVGIVGRCYIDINLYTKIVMASFMLHFIEGTCKLFIISLNFGSFLLPPPPKNIAVIRASFPVPTEEQY